MQWSPFTDFTHTRQGPVCVFHSSQCASPCSMTRTSTQLAPNLNPVVHVGRPAKVRLECTSTVLIAFKSLCHAHFRGRRFSLLRAASFLSYFWLETLLHVRVVQGGSSLLSVTQWWWSICWPASTEVQVPRIIILRNNTVYVLEYHSWFVILKKKTKITLPFLCFVLCRVDG